MSEQVRLFITNT